MTSPTPPPLELQYLDCHATIDYLTVAHLESRPSMLPALKGIPKWHKEKGKAGWELTVHDPCYHDIVRIAEVLHNPMLMKLELAVDFSPKGYVAVYKRDTLLRSTFVALAARFRPEDMTPWGYGPRASVGGRMEKPWPFHQSFPLPEKELFYGRKNGWLQSKMYFKRVDQDEPLPPGRHRIRMELTMRRGALMEFKFDRLLDVLGYPYRSKFTKHFRIVSEPSVRLIRGLDEEVRAKREKRMRRAWATAGVGKFAVSPDLPPDTDAFSAKEIRARANKQLPTAHYILKRHQPANAKIGDAFKKLQLRMTT